MRAVIGLVVVALGVGVLRGAPPASGPAPGDGALSGKAKWDPGLWTYYCKYQYEMDVPAEPQAFQQQQLLGQLNSEFATRLRCVIAVYQTASKLNDLGPAEGDGGLRSALQQKKIYQRGRKLKDGLTDPPNGNFAEDYEFIDKKHPKVDTDAWVSWHELGVASDLRQFVGTKMKQPQNTPMNKAFWSDTVHAMNDLGMIWGGYWPWDYGHVEWHPYLRSPQAINAQGHLAAIVGTPGHALSDQDMRYGYDWKIPKTLVQWNSNGGDDPVKGEQEMHVLTLVDKDNWLCVTKYHAISRVGDKELHADWATFDPPVRLVPVWIPVTDLMLESHNKDDKDDVRWSSSPMATLDSYWHKATGDGKQAVSGYTRDVVQVHFQARIQIHDWQKTAIIGLEVASYPGMEKPEEPTAPKPPASLVQLKAYQDAQAAYLLLVKAYEKSQADGKKRREAAETRFKKVIKASVYDIRCDLSRDSTKRTDHYSSRTVDAKGYTFDQHGTDQAAEGWDMHMAFSWDRDAGQVGIGDLASLIDIDHPSLEVRGVQCLPSGRCTLVGDRAPNSMNDIPNPPPWPAPNPKPPSTSHTPDGLRP